MRKLLTWLAVTIGIAALVRRLRRMSKSEPEWTVDAAPAAEDGDAPAPEETGDPAEELRRKLASARHEAGLSDAPARTEPEESEESVDARRANVHEQGKAALDEMQRSTEE